MKLDATEIKLRLAVSKDGPVITEAGNLILDVRFKEIPFTFEKEIKSIPGVIESRTVYQLCCRKILTT